MRPLLIVILFVWTAMHMYVFWRASSVPIVTRHLSRYTLLTGRYEVDGMPVIICRGTGTWGPRRRLWQRGEIIRITLRASQE